MNAWNNFADADEHIDRDGLIPAGTLVKVHFKIKAGGFDDPAKGWTGGLATRSDTTGSVYIAPEYTIMGGPFNKRKVWGTLIGLYSAKGPEWGNQGRSYIRAMLESARGVASNDTSERAMAARRINGLADLNGLEFVAKVSIEAGTGGYNDKNVIQTVIPVTHKDYRALMDGAAPAAQSSAPASTAPAASGGGTPAWMTN
jgi:hypothetical protein